MRFITIYDNNNLLLLPQLTLLSIIVFHTDFIINDCIQLFQPLFKMVRVSINVKKFTHKYFFSQICSKKYFTQLITNMLLV